MGPYVETHWLSRTTRPGDGSVALQAFTRVAQMLDPTFFVMRSSFCVVGVVDQFSQLRNVLAYPDTHKLHITYAQQRVCSSAKGRMVEGMPEDSSCRLCAHRKGVTNYHKSTGRAE